MNAAQKTSRPGIDHSAARAKGKRSASPSVEVRRQPAADTGLSGSSDRPKTLGSAGIFADGFLKTKFADRTNTIDVPAGEKAESELIRSLHLLCEFYGIPAPKDEGLGYPYNMTCALQSLQSTFKTISDGVPHLIEIDVQGTDFVGIERNTDVEHSLYYFGVQELYDYFKKDKPAAQVLLAIYSYLYYNAGVDYHTHEGSFLYFHYDMQDDLLGDLEEEQYNWDEDDHQEFRDRKIEMAVAKEVSEAMDNKIIAFHRGPKTLKSVTDSFSPKNEFHNKIKDLAHKFCELEEQYPKHRIYYKAGIELEEDAYLSGRDSDEELNYATVTTLDKCISFIHNGDMNTPLSSAIEHDINIDLQECYIQDFPTIKRVFNDESDYKEQSLDFENRIFPLMVELIDIIYELPNAQALRNIL